MLSTICIHESLLKLLEVVMFKLSIVMKFECWSIYKIFSCSLVKKAGKSEPFYLNEHFITYTVKGLVLSL
jgi:hypothetical protein